MREDTGTKGDLLVKVALGEPIAAELKFWGMNRVEVRVEDTEGVKVGNVVTANLVSADEQLDLRSNQSASSSYMGSRTFK